ncbi:helix-turn-helix domain-containing protein [Polaribacter sp. Hel1_85]|uniref:helix-turn-helix domain-containing protein n=1 Tax=Polaribacter sp. Hel1_85 TaxID=1250005 RepID=UPI0005651D13|nr:helix-turn-helix domain-containing protein [Polaribacter sp. Hel1_85]
MKKIIYYIILFTTLVYSKTTCSQNINSLIDSSYQYISEKYYEYKFIDSIKSKKLAEIFLKKAKKQKDTINTITGYSFLGEVFNDDKIYLNYIDSLIKKTKRKPTKMFPAYAYLDKGRYFIHKGINSQSLKNYLLVKKYTDLYRNDSLRYIAIKSISVLNGKNGNYSEAKKLRLKAYNFYNNYSENKENLQYCTLLINISSNYLKEKKYDSAIFFNEKALKLSIEGNFSDLIGYSFYRKGQIEFNQKKYLLAINNLKKSISGIIEDENYIILSKSYNLIAESYSKLNQQEKALIYNLKIDSLYQKTNITQASQKKSYTFLIKHYKEKKDLKNQLKYIEKLLIVDSILNSREKKLAKTFTEKYDIPKLKTEKEEAIKQLEEKALTSNKIKIVLGIIALLAIILVVYQYRKRKILKQRFYKLQVKLENKKEILPKQNTIMEAFSLSKDITTTILKQLDLFEANNEFTSNNITLNSLAKSLNTNSNYLSKTINHFKEKSFSSYLNDLRINYALEILQTDTTLKKYTIKAIANEVGFKKAESFSNAFYKKTGLKPSFYIKELNKKEVA